MYLTGKPDPTCGLTRTFAWMWRGDVGQAARVYPLGPALFLITFGLVAYYGYVLVSGSTPRLGVSPRWRRIVITLALVALGVNWTAKLVWLGM